MGATAIDYMPGRTTAFEPDGTPRKRDQAYRLLTAVEQIIEKRVN